MRVEVRTLFFSNKYIIYCFRSIAIDTKLVLSNKSAKFVEFIELLFGDHPVAVIVSLDVKQFHIFLNFRLRQFPLFLVLTDFLDHVVDLLSVEFAIFIVVVFVEDKVQFVLELLFVYCIVFSFAVVVAAMAVRIAMLATTHFLFIEVYWFINLGFDN